MGEEGERSEGVDEGGGGGGGQERRDIADSPNKVITRETAMTKSILNLLSRGRITSHNLESKRNRKSP